MPRARRNIRQHYHVRPRQRRLAAPADPARRLRACGGRRVRCALLMWRLQRRARPRPVAPHVGTTGAAPSSPNDRQTPDAVDKLIRFGSSGWLPNNAVPHSSWCAPPREPPRLLAVCRSACRLARPCGPSRADPLQPNGAQSPSAATVAARLVWQPDSAGHPDPWSGLPACAHADLRGV